MFRPLALQVSGALLGLALLASWPPSKGRLLLVPLTAEAAQRLATRALNGDARLVAVGPWPGSLVIEGTRAHVAGTGTLVLAAPAAACGDAA